MFAVETPTSVEKRVLYSPDHQNRVYGITICSIEVHWHTDVRKCTCAGRVANVV